MPWGNILEYYILIFKRIIIIEGKFSASYNIFVLSSLNEPIRIKSQQTIVMPRDSARKFMRPKISQLYFVKYKNTGLLQRENICYEKLRLAIQNGDVFTLILYSFCAFYL